MSSASKSIPRHLWTPLALAAGLALAAPVALAQSTIEKMKQFRVATTDLNLPTVPQGGANAAATNILAHAFDVPGLLRIELLLAHGADANARMHDGTPMLLTPGRTFVELPRTQDTITSK